MIQCVFDVPVSGLQFRSRPLNQESDFTSLVSIHIDSGIAFRPGTDLKLLPNAHSPYDLRINGRLRAVGPFGAIRRPLGASCIDHVSHQGF
ncbi:hypothetical protein CDAR_297401 [Caerostris darwini]|uniref:Uncharacterized protein n=1 Tax=Caerostris darwini TaxID=1538125 RepID=A0AAV4PT34_9ARAC|nr:hypothetical protein CDAR_297401 [Caerostris darwini]